jgi:hypothetical protein
MAIRIAKQREQGVLFRLDKVQGIRAPGVRVNIPVVDVPPPGATADRHHADPVPRDHHPRLRQR